jgi:antitoxin ParD1/3/4
MSISLKPDVQAFVDEKVRTGQFKSPDEAVNALLAHVRHQEQLTPDEIDELKLELDRGISEADAGNFTEFTAESVIAERRANSTTQSH